MGVRGVSRIDAWFGRKRKGEREAWMRIVLGDQGMGHW